MTVMGNLELFEKLEKKQKSMSSLSNDRYLNCLTQKKPYHLKVLF